MRQCLLLILLAAVIAQEENALPVRVKEPHELLQGLIGPGSNYDRKARPNYGNEPTEIFVTMDFGR